MSRSWAVSHPNGYEVSTLGDRRFSALNARLKDMRTIEQVYQLDVKGYRRFGNNWRLGKGRPALTCDVDLWNEYLNLWSQFAKENPRLLEALRLSSRGRVLTDCFAKSEINQAHALAVILDETEHERL